VRRPKTGEGGGSRRALQKGVGSRRWTHHGGLAGVIVERHRPRAH
jgi:hypothetical protein